jgi:hypothetical protein
MRFLFAAVLAIGLSTFAYALNPDTLWTRAYDHGGDDWAQSVPATPDGGFAVAGSTQSTATGKADFYLVKTDSTGHEVWSKTYGAEDEELCGGAVTTSDGGYILAGSTLSFQVGKASIYVVKTDGKGDTLWTRVFPHEYGSMAEDIIQTPDGGYALAGREGTHGEGHNMYLMRLDSTGKLLWTKSYGGKAWDDGQVVRQTRDGGFVLCGRTESYGYGRSDVYVVKTRANGDTLWTRTYGGNLNERGHDIQVLEDGGYIIVGETESMGHGEQDVYLIRADGMGDTLWTRAFGGKKEDIGTAVIVTTDGGFVITGHTFSMGHGDADVYFLRTNSSGKLLQQEAYGGKYWDGAEAICQTKDGHAVLAGATQSAEKGKLDMYLVRIAGGFVSDPVH